MARIPDDVIEKLKMSVDLAALIRARGVELKSHGENLVGRCPFHNDRTPSLVVTPSKNLWHCMGACQTGGSAIDFIMKIDKVGFRHAVELLMSGDSSALVSKRERLIAPKLASPIDPDMSDRVLLRHVIEFYHDTLLNRAPEAIEYLKARGIYDLEMIKKFKLGFSNRTLGLRLPESRRPEGEIRERLIEIGLYRQSGHEHFSGSLVIPVIDEDGVVTEVYGRKITEKLRSGTTYHTYLPGPHRGIFNPDGVQSGTVILCEALIDALSFYVCGFTNVTASYGVEGFTKDHLAYFKKYNVTRVYIAYDRDEAGDRAAEKLARRLIAHDIESLRIKFPRGMDANEYILKLKPADQALKLLIDMADVMTERKTNLADTPPEVAEDRELPIEEHEMAAAPPVVLMNENTVTTENPVKVAPLPAPEVYKPEPQPLQALDTMATEPPAPVKLRLPDAILEGDDIMIRLGDREYRVRGLKKNLSYEVMRVNLRVLNRINAQFFVDTIDFCQAKQRSGFIAAASHETALSSEMLKADLGKVLLKLEELQDIEIRSVLHGEKKNIAVTMTDLERNEALALLSLPNLLDQILEDFNQAGVVGEEANKLVGYLAAISRKLEDPLAIIIQSASSAGKSSLMDAVLQMMPDEDKVKYSAMTGQSLFYMGENDLKNKILAISEEQGAMASSYALKLLQSEGELSIASTGKNQQTGKLVTHEYRVEGPVMIFLTTTSVEVDEELLNRAILLTVNETREQTKLIHERQRRAQTLEGLLLRKTKNEIIKKHQNAQRLLKPLLVANPYAEKLTFLDNRTRTRRDHMKYLTLIRSIALLHQYQRQVMRTEHNGETVEYIEVEPRDIEIANKLCHEVLGRSLDELAPQTRKLLILIDQMVTQNCTDSGVDRHSYRFSRREVREWTKWSDFQVQVHIKRLVALEYVLTHRGGRGQSFVYELVYEATDVNVAESVLPGLIDPSSFASTIPITQNFKHQSDVIEGSNSPHIAPIEGGSRSLEIIAGRDLQPKNNESPEKAHIEGSENLGIVLPQKGAV